MTHTSTASIIISTDVTAWSNSQRQQLFDQIAAIEAHFTAPDLTEVEPSGWTYDLYVEAVSGLLTKHFVQAQAVTEAIKSGTGYISREDVYKLGGYPASRSLKGFTRPVNRITAQLTEEGKLPADAQDLLETVYDPNLKGYQRAVGFQVPLEVVKLALDRGAEQVEQ